MQYQILRMAERLLYVGIISLLLSACGSTAPLIHRLDPVTGVTTTRSGTPLVFYRDTPARAAHARDYVNLGPIQVNRMGEHRYFVWLGIWSTMQGWQSTIERNAFETVTVFVDGEPLQLELAGWTFDAIGTTEPVYLKPVATSIDAYYESTADQLRLIAGATSVRLLPGGNRPISYEPWENQASARTSLQAFVRNALD